MRRLIALRISPLVAALVVAAAAPAGAQTVGQIDTFEDGTTQGWLINLLGTGSPPAAVIPTNTLGGPGGPADHYLQLAALGGGGPGSRLSVINETQWTGDFLTSGIGAIGMDVNNFGPADVYLRLAFEDPLFGPPTNIAFSTAPVFVPAGSGWTNVVFPILPGSLSAALGSVNAALSNTTAIRLYHSQLPNVPNPFFPIATVDVQIGVDNIVALAPIPEPSTVVLVASGVLALAALRRRATRRG